MRGNLASPTEDELLSLLEQRVDEGKVNVTNAQVRVVFETLNEILEAECEAREELLRMTKGSTRQIAAISQELDDNYEGIFSRLETRLSEMGIELHDEKVIAALAVVKEFLTYADELLLDELS
jgi:hypothetical protein